MINIVIADDNRNVRNYFRKIIDRDDGIEVVGEAENGVEAVDQVCQSQVDILLLDIEMPQMTGIEVLQHLKAVDHAVRVLVISSYTDRELIRGALDLGARGYIFKEEAPESLVQAIRALFADHPIWLSQRAAASLFA